MSVRIAALSSLVGTLLVATSLPASAQMVDDFLCSTFSYKCNQQPPLPPPSLAPAAVPAPEATSETHAARKHKAKHKVVAKTDATKADDGAK